LSVCQDYESSVICCVKIEADDEKLTRMRPAVELEILDIVQYVTPSQIRRDILKTVCCKLKPTFDKA